MSADPAHGADTDSDEEAGLMRPSRARASRFDDDEGASGGHDHGSEAESSADDGRWVVTRCDEDDGLPVEGHVGHLRFHIDWDTRTATERRADRELMQHRIAQFARPDPTPPPDTLAA